MNNIDNLKDLIQCLLFHRLSLYIASNRVIGGFSINVKINNDIDENPSIDSIEIHHPYSSVDISINKILLHDLVYLIYKYYGVLVNKSIYTLYIDTIEYEDRQKLLKNIQKYDLHTKLLTTHELDKGSYEISCTKLINREDLKVLNKPSLFTFKINFLSKKITI